MAPSLLSTGTVARTLVASAKRPVAFYAVMAACLAALALGLYANERSTNLFSGSVAEDRIWAERIQRLRALRDFAGSVDAPGNDIFASHDVELEVARLQTASSTFRTALTQIRSDFSTNVAGETAGPGILRNLDRAGASMDTLEDEALRVFAFVDSHRIAEAAARMAAMDRAYSDIDTALANVNAEISTFQAASSSRHLASAQSLNAFEYALASALIAVFVGAALLARAMLRQAAENAAMTTALDRAFASAEFTLDGVLTTANENFLRIMGYELSEIQGQRHLFFCDPGEGTSDGYRAFWTALKRGELCTGIFRRVGKNGREVWIQASYYPVMNASGKADKIVKFFTDVTAQRQTDAAHARLAAIMEASDDAIIGKDLNGIITSWNRAAERLFGYTAADIVGRPDTQLIPATKANEEEALLAKLARGEHISQFETQRRRKDGSLVFVSLGLFPIRDEDGVITGFGKVARDITEQKQALTALAQFKAALDVHAIVAITDPKGKITYANDRFCEISKYSREELIGQDHRLINSGHHSKAFIRHMWETIKDGRVWKGEIKNRAKDGTFYWVDTSIIPVVDEDGKTAQFISIRADISDRKYAEQLLEQTATDLEDRNLELADARDHALAATHAKSAFLASMSHEIRTPMNAILGMADLLKETALSAEQQEYVDRFSRAGGKLLDLINDVLDISKVEAGQVQLESIPFNLFELVDQVGELVAVRAFGKKLELVSFVRPDVPTYVTGDPTRIRQVLVNLLGNAIKFTDRGEVALRVERRSDAGPDAIRFSVTDTGIGIPADKVPTIFESFTQVDSSTTRKYGGTGLGLCISKRLVELMGGHLGVDSTPGIGSTFAFELGLPVAAAPATALVAPPAELGGRRILVVDDNDTNRVIVRAHLAFLGAEVIEAAEGTSALDVLDDAHRGGRSIDLVILDFHMPGMNGIELAQAIRARRHGATVPLILYSSELGGAQTSGAREHGIACHLYKPISRDRLLQAVNVALTPATATVSPVAPPVAPASITPCQVTLADAPVRLLLVEDVEDNRNIITLFLKGGAYQIDIAENGAVGVEKFCAGQYDLVLMDIQMPVMDGHQATSAIRAWEREQYRHPTPIVALTANAYQEDVDKAIAAGCDAHVAKPIRKPALLKAILEHARRTSERAA